MAVTRVTSGSYDAARGSIQNAFINVGSQADRYLLVVVHGERNLGTGPHSVVWQPNSTPGDSDQAMTLLLGPTNQQLSVWGLVNPNPSIASSRVVVTFTDQNRRQQGIAILYSGVDQSSPVSGGVIESDASVDVASAVGDLVVGAIAHKDAAAATSGAGQTTVVSLTAGQNNMKLKVDEEAGASTVTMSWTGATAGTVTSAGISLKAVAAAGGPRFDAQIVG